MSKYNASGPQAEFEPGSNGRVLKNRLGIKSPEFRGTVYLFITHYE